jgi:aryl-alcohol dehydrogenase-like predicted oxidoreductase
LGIPTGEAFFNKVLRGPKGLWREQRMQTRKLGYSDLHLTTVGLGTWAIGGGGWVFGWGPQDDNDSIAAIRRALDLGINWIDTAAVYGLGHSEEIVGQAIPSTSSGRRAGRRDEVIIATKCGRVWDESSTTPYGRLKAESVRREVEASLRRLNVEVIDLYQIHWPNPDQDIEDAWGVIADLIREGKVRYGGVSSACRPSTQWLRCSHLTACSGVAPKKICCPIAPPTISAWSSIARCRLDC